MPRDYRQYLEDIVESINDIALFTVGMDKAAFSADLRTTFATLYALTIIGEAAARVPEDVRSQSEGVEWRKIVAMRNLIVHEYFEVDSDILWDVVSTKLPQVRAVCLELLKDAD